MITIRDVSKAYGASFALQDVSLELPRGSVTILQGPSGSGKTTLLRLIAGLEPPTTGEITIAGERVSSPDSLRPPYERGLGFVFQDAALWPHMTVFRNVAFGLLGHPRREIAPRVDGILAALGLTDLTHRYPNQLSGGEARRVSIARTLVTHPQRLLLDEPLTHVDPDLKARLLTIILEQVRNDACTLVYVTHDHDETEHLRTAMPASHVIMMAQGRLQTPQPMQAKRRRGEGAVHGD